MGRRDDSDTDIDSLVPWGDEDVTTTLSDGIPAHRRHFMGDDRPTEIYDPEAKAELHASREQVMVGLTIRDVIRQTGHHLSRPLEELVARARASLDGANIDARASLAIQHEFEFDRRVGYQLRLRLFDESGRCVEVRAEIDHDGREIRRGSLMSQVIDI